MSKKIPEIEAVLNDGGKKLIHENPFIGPVPCRVAIVGASMCSGKTTLLANLLVKPEFKLKFNRYVFVTPALDRKIQLLINTLGEDKCTHIPFVDSALMKQTYNDMREQYNEDGGSCCWCFDDVTSDGSLHGPLLNDLAQHGRHTAQSVFLLTQKFTQISTAFRENMTCLFLFSQPRRVLEVVENDMNHHHEKGDFLSKIKTNIRPGSRDFVVIRPFSNPPILNKDFKTV